MKSLNIDLQEATGDHGQAIDGSAYVVALNYLNDHH
jgi:hypothetical protein